jgi:hypothetical protein
VDPRNVPNAVEGVPELLIVAGRPLRVNPQICPGVSGAKIRRRFASREPHHLAIAHAAAVTEPSLSGDTARAAW